MAELTRTLTHEIEFTSEPLVVLERDATEALGPLRTFKIANQEQADACAKILQSFLSELDQVTEKEQRATGPLLASLAEIRSWHTPAKAALKLCADAARASLSAWNLHLAETRRQQFAAAQLAAKAGDMAKVTEALVASSAASPAKQEGVASWEVWEAEIVDPAAVPREWCNPDEKRINAHAKAAKGSGPPPAAIAGVVFKRAMRSRVSR